MAKEPKRPMCQNGQDPYRVKTAKRCVKTAKRYVKTAKRCVKTAKGCDKTAKTLCQNGQTVRQNGQVVHFLLFVTSLHAHDICLPHKNILPCITGGVLLQESQSKMDSQRMAKCAELHTRILQR
ncbi:MAG: hypothetical protein GY820_00070 [Gammaproteobacteria bacterium]|nr:hypothetical protein [Gammaproteobacteria bacterium]